MANAVPHRGSSVGPASEGHAQDFEDETSGCRFGDLPVAELFDMPLLRSYRQLGTSHL